MTFITASKSGPLNWLEGFALTTILQGFPIFAAASLMVKLLGDSRGSSSRDSPLRWRRSSTASSSSRSESAFPTVKNGYEAQFFDASLSFSEKIARWRAKPATSVQLMASVLLLSLLATIAG